MKLLSIAGDASCARERKGPHYHLLEEFHRYWKRIDILVPYHPEAKEKRLFDRVHFHIAPQNKWDRTRWIKEKGAELIREQHHDIIAAHDYPPFLHGKGARALSKETGIPHILEIYHIEGYPKAVNCNEHLRCFLTSCYIKKAWQEAKAIRVINKTQVPQWLIKQGVPKEKLKLLYSSYTDCDTFLPKDCEKKYDVLFIGRLVTNKGLFDLLQAVRKLPDVKACIVGVGPLEATLKKFVKKHHLQDRVYFTGWLETNKELAEHINASRSLVCCSRSEGGPRTTLEAMACAVPVISTAVGTMPDIILHRKNGLLIDFDAHSLQRELAWLLAHPKEAKKIGLKGRDVALTFERKKLIKEYALAYQQLAEHK